jgi:hypothetical protein
VIGGVAVGYNVDVIGVDWVIPLSNECAVLRAMKAMTFSEVGSEPYISWVNIETLRNASTLIEALHEWNCEVVKGPDGFVFSEWDIGKLGSEERLLQVLAPFSKEGSHVDVCGESNEYWRWVVRRGKLFDVEGIIDFNGNEREVTGGG